MLGIKPREDEFYKLLRETADLVCASSEILKTVLLDCSDIMEKMSEINELEHKADDITKYIIVKLNQTLVTPMDREDIYTLATVLDDIIDFIQGALERMVLYKATRSAHGVGELVMLLDKCVRIIKNSFDSLSNLKNKRKDILDNAAQINRLETEGDKLYRLEVAKLFEEETNPIEIIKWKEILEHMEDAIDRCEDLGDFIKGVVLKYA